MNSATFCRYCLSDTNEFSKEYFLSDEQDVYQRMVLDTYNIQVHHLKPAEKKVCVKCVVGIKAAAELKNMINLAQTKLLEQCKTLANEILDLNDPIKEEIEIDVKCEFVEEIPHVDEIHCESDDNDDGNCNITPLNDKETTNENETANESLMPCKSKDKYMVAYKYFLQWKNSKNYNSFSEKVFTTYFKELSNKYKPSSLWCIYSMLKTTVRSKNGVDIKSYSKLTALLKTLSNGFSSSKSKVLKANEIEKFINEAPDDQYLATKVALIFGITGACSRQELVNITEKDIKNLGSKLLINITNTENKASRSFTIRGLFCDIVKKYESLRSKKAKTDRFFQNYQKGKCTSQPIGINKFGSMPKEIAKFLGLPDAGSYTGHIFRRISATLVFDSESDFLTKKRQDGGLTDSSVKYSIQHKSENMELQCKKFFQEPSTSNVISESVYPSFGDEETILSTPYENDPLCPNID